MEYIPQPASLSEEQFGRISTFVKDVCGINLHTGKKELVKARLGKRLRTLGMTSFEDYFDRVRSDASGSELTMMLDALSTNLTSFFREPRHFEYLAKEIVPSLASRRGSARRLRIWSAGCSSGEEPYSIAMTLMEAMRDLSSWDARILGTDLSVKVLMKAKEGLYEGARMEGVPRQHAAKYFVRERGGEKTWRAGDALRGMVSFARLNLLHPWPMKGPFDVIFCRNVMIYFEKDVQTEVVRRFAEILAPGGVLFIGHSESLAGVKHRLNYVEPTIYRKA